VMTGSMRFAGSLLNEAQRRHLAVTLESVDRALMAVVRTHAPRVPGSQLRPWADDVPAAVRSGLAACGERARASLAEGVLQLGLEHTSQSTHRYLAAELTTAFVLLADARAAKMTAYGEVHPGLEAALDPWLAALTDQLTEMLCLLETGSDHAATG